MNYLFTHKNWFTDSIFAVKVAFVRPNSDELQKMLAALQEAQAVDIAIGQKADYCDMEVYEFQGASIPLRCQRMYIDLITNGHSNLYSYKYAPGLKVVGIYDEDGYLVGFVARTKNEGEE